MRKWSLELTYVPDLTIQAQNFCVSFHIAYIYPDMETVYLGVFENRKMIDAQESLILEVGCDENGIMLVKNYLSPNISVPHAYYEPPANISFGHRPKSVMDPYEQRWVELKMAENE